ncbi:MFS transporter [Ferrimicrobium sp.]|uniref:MFS transporter n=1 Tax=Ferrimicrobium sp. TaxID=2926050 RepID=UPI002612EA6D|nr:MFS transporter [Ferrimicrobium sp.]
MTHKRIPTLLLAIVAGVGVANTYYLQPLLHIVSVALHLSGGNAGFLITVTQAGFVVGLGVLLPLGDRFDRRFLIVLSLLLAGLFDVGAGLVTGTIPLGVSLIGVGIFSVVAQLAVTYVAAAAPPEVRSSEIAKVMAGLLAGIVLARTYSGALADLAGYHSVFLVAALASAILALIVWLRLPAEADKHAIAFVDMWRDGFRLLQREPILRLRSFLGMLSFGAFSIFWTTMAFALSAHPYHLSSGLIGLFGFAGLAGVLSARVVGALADRGHTAFTTVVSFSLIALSYFAFFLTHDSIVLFIVLTATLDAGIQGAQLSNQSLIYQLAPGAQGRITMVYMVFYFLGGVLGSSLASILYGIGGWADVTIAGTIAGVLGLVVWGVLALRERRWIQAIDHVDVTSGMERQSE